MGACGSKHSATVLETNPGTEKASTLQKHSDTVKDVHSDGSHEIPEAARRHSSGHLQLVATAASPPQSITKNSSPSLLAPSTIRKETAKEITIKAEESPLGEDVAAAQRFREERMARIKKRLEEAKAQVEERAKRVEALKSRNAAALTKRNNDEKRDDGKPQQQQSDNIFTTAVPAAAVEQAPEEKDPPTQQASQSSSNFKKVLETSALEWNFYSQQEQQQQHNSTSPDPNTQPTQKPTKQALTLTRQAKPREDASDLNLQYDTVVKMGGEIDPKDTRKEQSVATDTFEPLKGKPYQKQEGRKTPKAKKRKKPQPPGEEIASSSSRSYGRHDAGLSDELPLSSTRTTENHDANEISSGTSSYGASVGRSKRRVGITTESVAFSDITDAKLRRNALKLFKRLHHDPWDINNKYNDFEVFEFLEEHPETAAVSYDFEHFSGQIFPLSVLCTLGASLETVRLVYGAFPKAIDQCDPWIGTPLHYAMQHKAKAAVVSFLIRQHPFMLQERNQFGRLPLHTASLFKATSKTVSLLLEEYPQGADQVEKDGYTPLHLACENGSSAEVVKLLVDGKPERCLALTHTDASTPLHLACANKANVAVVAELLTVGADALDCYDAQGYAPLHVAVKHQASAHVMKYIIEAKPECIDMKTGRGYTVLSLAKKSNAPAEVLKMLEG